ncbi:MAG: PIG-L family deacetylase, partial [Actinobacteria bacterium]|nr:PIG-L family deacetylase [Actinomycetota bacterium]
FGAAGTIATLTGLGIHVSYCLVTSGDAGGDASTHTKAERAVIRENEQTAAAAVLGVTDLHFLGWPDGEVEPTLELRKEISRVIRITKPDLILCQSPERNWERIYASHPDHLASGEATMRAVYPDSRNPHSHVELLDAGHEPHTVPVVWVMSSQPTMVVDTTAVFEKKVAALRCHDSQVGHREDLDEMLRTWGETIGKAAGLPDGHLAEGFRPVSTQ